MWRRSSTQLTPGEMRYLAAFGPASAADVQTWSGLTRLGEVLERLTLKRFKTEAGQTLYDLPDAARPDPDTAAPVRLVAPFDNILLSHADRTRVISDEHRKRLFSGRNGSPAQCSSTGSWQAHGNWQAKARRRVCGCSSTGVLARWMK